MSYRADALTLTLPSGRTVTTIPCPCAPCGDERLAEQLRLSSPQRHHDAMVRARERDAQAAQRRIARVTGTPAPAPRADELTVDTTLADAGDIPF